VAILYILPSVPTLSSFWPTVVCELGIKDLVTMVARRVDRGSECPAETPRTRKGNHWYGQSPGRKRENRGECVKYNVTEGLPNACLLRWSFMRPSIDQSGIRLPRTRSDLDATNLSNPLARIPRADNGVDSVHGCVVLEEFPRY